MMVKQIILFISSLIIVTLSQSSESSIRPTLLSFFSNDQTLGSLFIFNRVDLETGLINITLPTRSIGNGKLLGVNDYDGVNWFDFQFYQAGAFYDGGMSDLQQGDTSASYYNWHSRSGLVDFMPHPLGKDDALQHLFSVGWQKQTNELLVLGFNDQDNEMYFYFNTTQFSVEPQYQNSVVQCYYDQSKTMYINYIEPTSQSRTILTYLPFNHTDSGNMEEYSFGSGSDATTSVNSRVYLFYSVVGNQNESPLYMVEVANNTGSASTINLLNVQLSASGYTASSKVILSLDNQFGSEIDGIPFAYIDPTHEYLILVSKPTSATEYTITTVEMANNYKTSSITTELSDLYNFGLYYH